MDEMSKTGELATVDREKYVGLDVLGPGGGQWTVMLAESRAVFYEPGIRSDCGDVLTIDSVDFSRPASGDTPELGECFQAATCTDLCELATLVAEALFPAVSASSHLHKGCTSQSYDSLRRLR